VGDGVVAVYAQYGRNEAIWVARNKAGFFTEADKLPAELRKQFHLR